MEGALVVCLLVSSTVLAERGCGRPQQRGGSGLAGVVTILDEGSVDRQTDRQTTDQLYRKDDGAMPNDED